MRRIYVVGSLTAVALTALAAVALASGGAHDSKGKLKVKCPAKAKSGKKVTCKVVGKPPRGPKGAKGARGATGPAGPSGGPGTSGYEVVSETFPEVFVINSGGQRGLSEVQTVQCPAGKRVLGGGADLGTDATQNGQQRQVTVSLSGPNGSGSGWSVQLFNNSTSIDTSIDLRVYAICANVG